MPRIQRLFDPIRHHAAVMDDAESRLIWEALQQGERVCLAADQRIYMDGDTCGGIGFLLAGAIRVYKIGDTGREITLYDVIPGETCILNVSCLLSGRPYPAHAAATEDGALLALPGGRFVDLMARSPAMRGYVFAILNRRFSEIITLVEEVAFGRLDTRLMNYLEEKSVDGILRGTHQEIANDLGSSREVVSRLLKEFERQGRIRLARTRIEIVSLTGA